MDRRTLAAMLGVWLIATTGSARSQGRNASRTGYNRSAATFGTVGSQLGRFVVLVSMSILMRAALAAPLVYVPDAASGGGIVSIIDAATNTVTSTIAVGIGVKGVAVNATGTRVYLSHNLPAGVSVIDTATNVVTAFIPRTIAFREGIAVSPIGARAYVVCQCGLEVMDTTTNAFVAVVPLKGGSFPIGVAVNPAGTRVYVTGRATNELTVVDTASNAVMMEVSVGLEPYGVALNPSGTRIYVSNRTSGTVSVIDAALNTVLTTVAVGGNPAGLVVSPDGARVYVAMQADDRVSVIDAVNNAVVATISVGPHPTNIDVNRTGTRLYVANANPSIDNVSVIDTASNTLVGNVSVTGFPLFLGRFIADPQLGHSITTEVPTMSTVGTLLLAALLGVICAYRLKTDD